MRLLVLGGTRFLGRGVVEAAVAAGDQVTTFTRGVSGDSPDGVEALHGDRSKPDGMDVLRGREWDAVVDTSGFVPAVVGRGAALLADSVGHYVFISSINAYPGFPEEPVTADSPVHDCAPDAGSLDGEFDPELYGPYKVGSERAVEQHFPGRAAQLRSGLIIGPHDNTGRLPYWVERMVRGGEVLAPGEPDRTLRLVDSRDLGGWAVELGRTGTAGTFVASGPADQGTFGSMLAAAAEVAGSDATVTWVPEQFVVEQGIAGWTELPLWLPATQAPYAFDQDTTAAERAGLRTRPVAETVRDVHAWLTGPDAGTTPNERTGRAGLDPEKEKAALAAWHRAQGARGARGVQDARGAQG
jgi:2'-hydroxyisoflavone reductase